MRVNTKKLEAFVPSPRVFYRFPVEKQNVRSFGISNRIPIIFYLFACLCILTQFVHPSLFLNVNFTEGNGTGSFTDDYLRNFSLQKYISQGSGGLMFQKVSCRHMETVSPRLLPLSDGGEISSWLIRVNKIGGEERFYKIYLTTRRVFECFYLEIIYY